MIAKVRRNVTDSQPAIRLGVIGMGLSSQAQGLFKPFGPPAVFGKMLIGVGFGQIIEQEEQVGLGFGLTFDSNT